MRTPLYSLSLAAALLTAAADAGAVASAELYQNQTYTYGRFEARVRFAAGDGIISSFFLWKPGSEMPGTFWNELDFEKLGADCRLQTNPLYGLPVVDHSRIESVAGDLCSEYHTYTFEWTPDYIAYFVDGVELRRDGEEAAAAFTANAASGMQIHFNIWPGDATFGGNFDPASLPVQQFISWVQYSSFAGGEFTLQWREEFDGPSVPSGWAVGNWASPKNLSTHQSANVTFSGGVAVLSLTADAATGFAGAAPPDPGAMGAGSAPEPAVGAGGAAGIAPPSTGNGGSASGSAAAGASGAGPASVGDNSSNESSSEASEGTSATAAAPAGEASAAPVSAPARSTSDGGCSISGVSARGVEACWLALASLALFTARRRRAWFKRGRTGISPLRHCDAPASSSTSS